MISIKDIGQYEGQEVELKAWVANKRTSKGLVFLSIRDGSAYLQCVVSDENVDEPTFEKAKKLTLESSLSIKGKVIKDEKQEGGYELQATDLNIYQVAADYPIAKKAHGIDFLMDKRHLWVRSRKPWAIMRVRSRLKFAIHQFFQDRAFIQTDSPIFTGNAAEGSTTLFSTDFFGDPAYLAQTGQLYGEAMCMAHGKVYTFGPTFRAEKSKTRRHLAEFWMIEPEMAYYDLDMNMDLIEEFIKYIANDIFTNCVNELNILERDLSLFDNLKQTFPRITHAEAVKIIRGEKDINGKNSLKLLEQDMVDIKNSIEASQKEIEEREAAIAAGGMKKGQINWNKNKIDQLKAQIKEQEEYSTNIPQWLESAKNFKDGEDFGGSDETILTRLFGTPVFVYKWPKAIKAFYMKQYEDDPDYVKGVDLLAPEGFGEIVGGSERESDLEVLLEAIKAHNLPMEDFEWFLDLRRFGSVPHAGFGMGFERMLMWITGIKHIREVIPFPRYYGRLFP